MGRQTDNGLHEGWILHLFADGCGGGGGTYDKLTVSVTPDGTFLRNAADWIERPPDEVVAWQAVCQHPVTGEIHWRGPRVERVATSEQADPDQARGYSEDGWAEDGDPVTENCYIDWEVHIAPFDLLREITEISMAITELETRRLNKVSQARAFGQSWEAIGNAAGIARQSAWERWAKHTS